MSSLILTHEQELAEGRIEHPRSPQWPKVRDEHLKVQPVCQVCGGRERLNVHHIKPFHLHPELELDPANLITLCEEGKNGLNCHLWFGHLGDFQLVNPSSVTDAADWSGRYRKARA